MKFSAPLTKSRRWIANTCLFDFMKLRVAQVDSGDASDLLPDATFNPESVMRALETSCCRTAASLRYNPFGMWITWSLFLNFRVPKIRIFSGKIGKNRGIFQCYSAFSRASVNIREKNIKIGGKYDEHRINVLLSFWRRAFIIHPALSCYPSSVLSLSLSPSPWPFDPRLGFQQPVFHK